MEFRVLGPLEVVADGRRLAIPTGRQRALLALLLIHAGRVLSTDRIADELWAGEPPERGARALSFHVSKLRDALEPGRARGRRSELLATEPTGYVVRLGDGALDSRRFEDLAAEGRERLTADPASALARYDEGLALWRGDAYEDVADEPFARAEINRLEELRLRVAEDRLEALLILGRHTAVAADAASLLDSHPLRERLRGQLMTALYRSGRQAEALAVFEDGRRLLADELGIDPSAALQQLQVDILRQDPRLEAPARAGAPGRNPYKGLRPFEERDSADFHGREALVARLVDRLAEVTRSGRLLLVAGPSGCGKSSVLRAGLIPALRAGALPGSERWPIATMLPGAHPFAELAAALREAVPELPAAPLERLEAGGRLDLAIRPATLDPRARLVLVVDQFEELFSLVEDDEARSRFLRSLVDALAEPSGRLLLVAVLRADYLDRPLLSAELGELARDGIELVPPLDRHELERAIRGPAETVGVEVEPGLAVEIVGEVARQPGTLPLLQYALTELFQRSDGRRLTREAYAAIGGVTGALGRRAEMAYAELDEPQRDLSRQLFLRLIALEAGSAAVPRRVPRAELGSLEGETGVIDRLIDRFAAARLLALDRDPVSGEATVEIAHESLLSRWSRLAAWVDEERQAIWTRGRLAGAAGEWVSSGRDPGFLLTGARLDLFSTWAGTTDLRLNELERRFLEASRAERQRLDVEHRARLAHEQALERRATTRLRALVALFAVAALVGILLLVAVIRQGAETGEQAAIGRATELAAASVGRIDTDPDLGLLLAVQAALATADRGYVTEDAYDALHWALQASRAEYPPGGNAAESVGSSPDGLRGLPLLPPPRLIDLAIERAEQAARSLSEAECRTYLHLSACPTPVDPSPVGRELDVYTADGPLPVDRLPSGSLAGTTVSVVSELPVDIEDLEPMVAPFGEVSGVRVTWDVATVGDLENAARDGRPLPDVALVARPRTVEQLAVDGRLMDLGVYLDQDRLRERAGGYLAALGTVGPGNRWPAEGGRLYGVPVAASLDGLVWYPAARFREAGYRVPDTWDELLALSRQIVADRGEPWCIGTQEPRGRDGESLARWVEALVLRQAGSAVYDGWARGAPGFDAPDVRAAFEELGAILFGKGFVYGTSAAVSYIPGNLAALPMALDPPGCWLSLAASTDWSTWPAELERPAAFELPGPSDASGGGVLGHVYTVAVFHDRPEIRRLVAYLVGDEGGSFRAAVAERAQQTGVFPVTPSDGTSVPDVARDPLAELLQSALRDGRLRVGATDLMPSSVVDRFDRGMLDYVAWSDVALDEILRDIQKGWFPAGD